MKEGKRVYVNAYITNSLIFCIDSCASQWCDDKKNEKERKSESEILVYMLHCLALEQVLQQYCCYAQFKYI